MREHPPDVHELQFGRGHGAVVDRVHHLRHDPDLVGVAGERVERGGHAALQ
jgi:hypothetical protein